MSKSTKSGKTHEAEAHKTRSKRHVSPLIEEGPHRYGNRYYCVNVPYKGSVKPIYFWADGMEVYPNGQLIAWSYFPRLEGEPHTVLAIPAGRWVSCYATDSITGKPIVIDTRGHDNLCACVRKPK